MWGALLLPGVAISLRLWAPWNEPEVVQDLDGRAWYRVSGADATQQAIEACVKLGNEQMVSGGTPTNEAVCDKPVGNSGAAPRWMGRPSQHCPRVRCRARFRIPPLPPFDSTPRPDAAREL
jgi:hypothetical protein